MGGAAKYLLLSLGSFNLFALVCFVLRPDAFVLNAPLSYYGTNSTTIVPYSIGVLLATFFLFKSALSLTAPRVKTVRLAIIVIAWAFLGSWLFPYSLNGFFWAVHSVAALVLFTTMLLVSVYVVVKLDRRPRNLLILVLQIVAFVLIWLSAGPIRPLHVTAFGELLMDWMFVALMCNTLQDVGDVKSRIADA